jgi:hypothetical protein
MVMFFKRLVIVTERNQHHISAIIIMNCYLTIEV